MNDTTPVKTKEILVPQVPRPWLEVFIWGALGGILLSGLVWGFLDGHAWDVGFFALFLIPVLARIYRCCWDNVIEVPE